MTATLPTKAYQCPKCGYIQRISRWHESHGESVRAICDATRCGFRGEFERVNGTVTKND